MQFASYHRPPRFPPLYKNPNSSSQRSSSWGAWGSGFRFCFGTLGIAGFCDERSESGRSKATAIDLAHRGVRRAPPLQWHRRCRANFTYAQSHLLEYPLLLLFLQLRISLSLRGRLRLRLGFGPCLLRRGRVAYLRRPIHLGGVRVEMGGGVSLFMSREERSDGRLLYPASWHHNPYPVTARAGQLYNR